MSDPNDDFAELMASAGRGDPQAITRLVEKYEPKVRLVARVLLGRALRPFLDSADLVQSVHRSLLIGMQQQQYDLTSPDQLVALAITIVRRKVARQWRKAQRQQRLSGGSSESGQLSHLLASLSDSRDDPVQAAEFHERLEILCQNLDVTERRMLEMRLQGYTAAEVGQELGLHAIAVRVRWTRLRQRLHDSGVTADWV